ncbi:MAG: hypothetical protein ACREN5_13560, partial [Gemmatimonadales bacterium]
ELEGIIPFIKGDVYQTQGLGWNDKARWEDAVTILMEQKVIERKPEVEAIYTNQFISKTY